MLFRSATSTVTTRYGMAVAAAWDRVHPRLTHRAAWPGHDGPLPVIEGTLIRLQVDHLPGDRDPKQVWLWWSATGALPADVDRCWRAFLRRFDLERSKPQCCHNRGWPASLLAPSSPVFMSAAWPFLSSGKQDYNGQEHDDASSCRSWRSSPSSRSTCCVSGPATAGSSSSSPPRTARAAAGTTAAGPTGRPSGDDQH